MRRRFKIREEEIQAMRNQPAFRALVKELKSQSPEQIDRLETWTQEQAEKEQGNGRESDDW